MRPRGPKAAPQTEIENGLCLSPSVSHSRCAGLRSRPSSQRPTVSVSSLQAARGTRVLDGLRVGLRKLGFEEGKQFVLAIRDTKGDTKVAEEAARNLEQEKVALIYTTQSSVTHNSQAGDGRHPHRISVPGPTRLILGSWTASQNRGEGSQACFTGTTDLTAKRLELLKEMVPKLRRVVTFYDPRGPVGSQTAKLVREVARPLGVELFERHFASLEELQAGIRALSAKEMDAFFEVSDAQVALQNQLIIDTARVKKLPTMFQSQSSVIKGGLASYSVSRHEIGRLSAKYVQRILTGVKPKDLPVEGVDNIDLFINLKTAKQIGLTVPPNVLARAQKVIR